MSLVATEIKYIDLLVLNYIQYVKKYFNLKKNNKITRKKIIVALNSLIKNKLNGFIVDYRIICDQTNNPHQIIESGKIIVTIYLKYRNALTYEIIED